MAAPDGGFYTSMGLEEKAGKPGVDKRKYARETGSAIAAVIAYYEATGEAGALRLAEAAAEWAVRERSLPGGGFRHAEVDAGGPYLSDSLAMAQAFGALYRASAERHWLRRAEATADFIARNFIEAKTGGFLNAARPAAKTVGKPVKSREDNVAAVRLFNQLWHLTGNKAYRAAAEAGMGYLGSPAVLDAWGFLPDVLLAEGELTHEPARMTVVGAKDDPKAAALFRAALAYPSSYKRIEWWDRREGKLPNSNVVYPDYPEAAGFACTSRFCSLPVTLPGEVTAALDRLERALDE